MDEVTERVVKAVRERIPDARVVMFGSRAGGGALKYSDIDLIVVSKAFEGMHFTDRASHVLRIPWEADTSPPVDVDPPCYTPEERGEGDKRREGGATLRGGVLTLKEESVENPGCDS